jgi:hypothetical protein
MGLPDFFDLNSVGTDSHLQFLNWTTDNNGAWDYAADTRGYTYGRIAEYDDRIWSARYGIALMPVIANGISLDWDLRRASGQNTEVEWRHNLLGPLVIPKPERRHPRSQLRQPRPHGPLPRRQQGLSRRLRSPNTRHSAKSRCTRPTAPSSTASASTQSRS